MMINWLDAVIVAVVLYFLYEGWRQGFVYLGTSFFSFLLSLWLAVSLHTPVSFFISDKFGIPQLWSTVIAYIGVAFIAQVILSEALSIITSRISRKIIKHPANQWLGAMVSVVNGLVLLTFFLLVLLAVPIRGTVKNDIHASVLAKNLIRLTQQYASPINSSVEEAVTQAKRFLTVPPESRESITLDVSPNPDSLRADEDSEKKLRDLVNEERVKIGLSPVFIDSNMVAVARTYSKDMFNRRFFSHVSPDGEDASDRLARGGVVFVHAGENLAYAPDVTTAHEGLMKSEGHRNNILDRRYRRIGIGVIDAGVYGKMFTQLFAD